MGWICEWGPHIEMLERIWESTGNKPKAFENAPKLDATAEELVEAFRFLTKRRTVGMSANPIGLADIQTYIDVYGAPSVGRELFIELIVLMDDEYLKVIHGRNKTPSKR